MNYTLVMLMLGLKGKWEKDCEGPFISRVIGGLEKILSRGGYKKVPLERSFWLICGIVIS